MIIRKFQPADLEAILDLFHDVVHTVGAKYYDSEQVNAWAPKDVDREKWLKSLSENITYVVEDKGKIIAFGDMTKTGYVDRCYVHKNYQGSKASRLIYKMLEEAARELGLSELTCEASTMLMPIAQRIGFEVVEKQTKIHRGVEFIIYKMRKTLKFN
jgi:putative acetyltransferase